MSEKASFAVAVVVALALGTSPGTAQEIFIDAFESADVSAWSSVVGYLPAPTAFRFADLDLRDPHLFIDVPLFGCSDFTDDPLPLGLAPSFNDTLEAQITGDDDGDQLLDLSLLLLFRPLDVSAVGERLDLVGGECSAPLASTTCGPDPLASPFISSYDGLAAGVCLMTVPGTTSGYVPTIAEPLAPCFVNSAATLQLELGGLTILLQDTQLAAAFMGAPPPAVDAGLMRGFLRESDADAVLLPPDTPLVGGQPLSILLPGGSGNCAAGDDRDLHEGESGWWFYLNYRAVEVPYSWV